MRLFATILLLLYISAPANSQQNKKVSYLVVRIAKEYDNINNRQFVFLKPDSDNVYAQPIYKLVVYNPRKWQDNIPAYFYYNKPDSSQFLYNYFRNENEALQFIGQFGWELTAVNNEIYSEGDQQIIGGSLQAYTKVISTPVYYFRRILAD